MSIGYETAVSREYGRFASYSSLFDAAIFQTHNLFNGCSGSGGLALVIFQTGTFFLFGNGPDAETDFLFGLIEFDDLEIEFLANGQGGLIALGGTWNFGIMAQALDAGSELDEDSKVG